MTNGPITEPRPASSTPATSMGESLFTLLYLNFKVILLYLFYGLLMVKATLGNYVRKVEEMVAPWVTVEKLGL